MSWGSQSQPFVERDIQIYVGYVNVETISAVVHTPNTSWHFPSPANLLRLHRSESPHRNIMKESAVTRTPVEIWRYIFDFVLQWLELPVEDDAPLKYITFDWSSCRRYHLYSSTLYYRRSLRLVCRSWRQLIDTGHAPFSIRLAREEEDSGLGVPFLLNQPLLIFNSGECITTNNLSICTQLRPCPRGFDSTPRYNAIFKPHDCEFSTLAGNEPRMRLFLENSGLADQENMPQIKVSQTKLLLLQDNFRRDSEQLTWLLKHARNLQILRWIPTSPNDVRLIGQLACLTMVNLCIKRDNAQWADNPLVLPALHHLRIEFQKSFIWGILEDHSEEFMTKWRFMNLSIIEAQGIRTQRINHNLTSLALRHCDTITTLAFYLNPWPEDVRWCGESSIWNSFSRLSSVGISLRCFCASQISEVPTPFSPSGAPLTIFLLEFRFYPRETAAQALKYAKRFVDWCKSLTCGVELIAINISWRNVKDMINLVRKLDDDIPRPMKAFLEEMVKTDIPFYDSEGISLQYSDIITFLTIKIEGDIASIV